jgi:hypothetical protein
LGDSVVPATDGTTETVIRRLHFSCQGRRGLDEAIATSTNTVRSTRGHRDERLYIVAAIPRRGGCRRCIVQCVDALYGRRRIRPGGGDRHLHTEDARARPDGLEQITSMKYVVYGSGQVR